MGIGGNRLIRDKLANKRARSGPIGIKRPFSGSIEQRKVTNGSTPQLSIPIPSDTYAYIKWLNQLFKHLIVTVESSSIKLIIINLTKRMILVFIPSF